MFSISPTNSSLLLRSIWVPIRLSFALLVLVLYEFMGRLIVRGYEVVAPPAIVGEAIVRKSRIGQTDYEIEPIGISE